MLLIYKINLTLDTNQSNFSSSILRESVTYVGDFDIFSVLIIATNFENERTQMRFQLLLRNFLHHFGHQTIHAFVTLRFLHEEGVKHANALRQHRDLEFVFLLEVLEKFAESHFSLHLKTIPQSPFDVVIFIFCSSNWLRESNKWQCQVQETVFETI